MSRDSFIRRIQANLEHWLAAVRAIESYDFTVLDPEWFNLLQSIRYGLDYPETQPAAAELWKALIGYVEARGYLGPWEKVTQRVQQILGELRPAQACRVANEIGFFYASISQPDHAIAMHEKALAWSETADDAFERGLAHMGIGNAHLLLNRYREAETETHRSLKILSGINGSELRAAGGHSVLGVVHLDRGDYAAAEDMFRKACRTYLGHDHRRKAVLMLYNLAIAQHRAGHSREAIDSVREAMTLLDPDAGADSWANLYLILGTIYFETDDFKRAKSTFLKVDQRGLEKHGLTEPLALANNNLGNVALKEEDWVLARDYLAFAADLYRQLQDDINLGNTLGDLADAQLRLGERTPAKANLDEAVSLLRKHPENAWARKRLSAILAQRESAFGR